jgi:hypothetical protein
MLTAWTVILVALAYVGVLFAIASYGDRAARRTGRGGPRPLIYALSLAVYCTSWAYFGSVGLAATSGYDFLPIYIGPVLMLTVGWPVLRAIVDISKRQNITSIADFISARYGKNQPLGALVAIIAVIGVIPYISLQLKAVSFSLTTLLPPGGEGLHLAQSGAYSGGQAGAKRSRPHCRHRHGGLCRAVRHPPGRRHRAPARAHPRHRGGIGVKLAPSWPSASSPPSG